MTKQQKILFSLVVIIAGIGGVFYFLNTSNTSNTNQTINSNSSSSNTVPSNAVSNNSTTNTNGAVTITSSDPSIVSKSATVAFDVPDHNTNNFTLRITENAGIITDVSYSVKANDETSQQYYSSFVKSFKTSNVVGKKISDVSLSRVGGASLTTKAFMSALSQIAAK